MSSTSNYNETNVVKDEKGDRIEYCFLIAFGVFGLMCIAVAFVILFKKQLKSRCKSSNDQIVKKEFSLVSVSGNEVENPAVKGQILIESNEEDEDIFVENVLHDSSNQILSPEINKSVPMEEGSNTNFQKTQTEINNRNDEGNGTRIDKTDKTRLFIDGQNISKEEFSSDDDACRKQNKNSSNKRNSNSKTERLKENRICNKQKDIASAHKKNNRVESNVSTYQCSNDEERISLDCGNEASFNEERRVSHSRHHWVTQHSGIYHDSPLSTTNECSSNSSEEEFVDNFLYGNPEEIMLENNEKSLESGKKDNIDQHSRIDVDNASSTTKECTSYSDEEEYVDNSLYANRENILSEIKKYHESKHGYLVVPHPPKISPTRKKGATYFVEDEDHFYEDPEEMLEAIQKSNESDKRDLISHPSIHLDKISSTHKKCATEDGHQYEDVNEIQTAKINSHIHPHSRIYQDKTSSTANECLRDSQDEELVDNVLYANPEIILKSGTHSIEDVFPEKVPSTTKEYPSHFDKEELVDNLLYGDPDEIILESGTPSLESEKKDFSDSYPRIFPEKVPYTAKECPSHFDKEEFVDNVLYDDPDEIILESGTHSLEAVFPEKISTITKECPSHFDKEEFEDNVLYDDPDEIILESGTRSLEAVFPEKISTITKECPSHFDKEEFEDNVLYDDPEEIILESGTHSLENVFPEKVPSTTKECPSNFDKEEFEDNVLYDDPEIILESGTHSLESEKKDLGDSHPCIFPEKVSSTTKECPSCFDNEEFVDDNIYDDAEDIM